MGPCLGSSMGEILTNKLKDILFSPQPHFAANIVYWYRYMGDMICLGNDIAQTFNDLLMFLRKICPTKKFTAEFGGKATNFLDLDISVIDNHHEF